MGHHGPRRAGVALAKIGIVVCHHCQEVVEAEHIRVSHRFIEGDEEVSLDFCSSDCMFECFWDDEIQARINKKMDQLTEKVDKEIRWFHSKGICPSCRERIKRLIHSVG